MHFHIKPYIEGEISKLLPKNGSGLKVLDLGCGEGLLSKKLYDNGYTVIAADLFPENFRFHDTISCRKIDFNQKFPFGNEEFDIIVSSEVYEHLENHMFFAMECNRIVKKNGILIFSTPNILNLKSRIKFLFTGFTSGVEEPTTALPFEPVRTHIGCEPLYVIASIFRYNGFLLDRVSSSYWKESAAFWLWLYPFISLFTFLIRKKQKSEIQKQENKRLFPMLVSLDVLLGRSVIVKFIKM